MMLRFFLMIVMFAVSFTGGESLAQSPMNLVASHEMKTVEGEYTQIKFKMKSIPKAAVLSFDVRFEPRFV